MRAARILNRKITDIERATSSSSASITGAVAAMAEPPHIDEPTPISTAALDSIFSSFIIIKAVMSDEEIVQIITGRLLLLTEKTVDRSQDKTLCSAVRLHELPNSCGKTSSDTDCRENCNNIIKKLCKIKRLCGIF